MNSKYDSEGNKYFCYSLMFTAIASFDSTLTLERLINNDIGTSLFDGIMTLFFGGMALYNYKSYKDYCR